jgi:phosphoribosylformylglycinamidine synthase II
MSMPEETVVDEISQRSLDEVALTRAEYEQIVQKLGRRPNQVELGMFGAMWSEHCGYKNSKPLLRRFPTRGPRVLLGAGAENAGAVDIGDGLAVAMKIESHNHPSAIEPYQGAATGVGGIVRDIFTMGARPVAVLNSLRFGPPTTARNRYLLHGVVGGIAGYGNCLGLPTIGGEVYFDEVYSGNPLVNALCVGIVPVERMIPARASGPGNPVLLVGADTGRDGIHGATFASVELNESSEERRPAVQVGNPFTEKLLIEACLALRDTGWIVGMQDLGAAGLTSSSVEIAHKGRCGIALDVLRVSRRESGMNPYEIMLSESQERMLVVARRGCERQVQEVFARWGLHSDIIGQVIEDRVIRIQEGESIVAEIPTALLTDEVPLYVREGIPAPEMEQRWVYDYQQLSLPDNLNATLLTLLASPDLCSRQDIYRQYDHMVGANTLIPPGSDAAVLRVRDEAGNLTGKAIALTTDGNGRLCYLDPFNGGALAVAEAARNLVCTGATPLALTNCLNFANPEKADIYYQLEQAIEGMAAAARALETPVISGNVSLYNESFGQPIYPTPIVGMVGLLEGDTPLPAAFQHEGDLVALLGAWEAAPDDLGGSTYLKVIAGEVAGRPPQLDLQREMAVQHLCLEAFRAGLLCSAHDCSDGGLAVALAESCIWGNLGMTAEAHLLAPGNSGTVDLKTLAFCFGEAPSRIVVSLSADAWPRLNALAEQAGVPVRRLGTVGGDALTLDPALDTPVVELARVWRQGLGEALHGPLA